MLLPGTQEWKEECQNLLLKKVNFAYKKCASRIHFAQWIAEVFVKCCLLQNENEGRGSKPCSLFIVEIYYIFHAALTEHCKQLWSTAYAWGAIPLFLRLWLHPETHIPALMALSALDAPDPTSAFSESSTDPITVLHIFFKGLFYVHHKSNKQSKDKLLINSKARHGRRKWQKKLRICAREPANQRNKLLIKNRPKNWELQ